MSTTIDEKVVEMKFDNSDFEKNVKTSMSTLESLKNSLNFSGASKGLEDFSDDVGTVSKSFSALEVMAVAALVNITNSAIDAGKQLVESLTIDQVAAGWEKYAEKTQAVQTIMAATGLSIDEVNEQLEKLNWFTDETSYNFTDMTNNIGKFTSQGVELESAVTAMEGISTWAALSGGNVEEASRAMYNLSQAMGVGAVKLQDWKSIENANMATKEFKETAIESALSLGTLTKSADGTITTLKDTEVTVANFSSTLSDCWFSSDVLIDTLNKYGSFADALNVACEKTNLTASELLVYLSDYKNGTLDLAEVQKETALSASELTSMFEGLSDETFTLGDKAFRAAQEAKTFKEAVDSVKDAVSTGWMTTFEIIFGNYEQAKELWTDLANAMYDAFAESGNTRNELLKEALGEESAMLSVSEEAWSNYAKTNKESLSVFEDALIKTAREHGIAIDDMIEQEGSFAATLKHGWLTDNIITEALSNLTTSVETATTSLEEIEEVATRVIRGEFGNGADRIKALTEAGYDYATVQSYVNHVLLGTEFQFEELSDAQLENMGYTEEQIETLRELAKQAEETGTPLNELIESLNRPSGRDNLVQSFWNTWEAVSKLIGSIKGAWDEIFPAATADQIYNFTVALEEFTSHLIISDETADTLKRTFKGLFAILDIGYQAISALAGGFKNLISFILPAGNGILGVTGSIGDFFVAVDEAVKSSEIFSKTIQAIGKVLEPVAVKARSFITLMLEGIANAINWANENNVLGNVINNFGNILSAVAEIVRNWIKAFASLPAVQSAITKFSTAASNTLSNLRSYFSGGMEQIAAFVERVKAMDSLSLDNFKVMLKDFKDNVLGYFLNIDGVFDDFTKLLGDFRDSVVSRMKEIRDNFSFDSVKDILGSFSDFLKEKFDGIGENLSGFKKIVFDVFGAVKDFLAENIGAIIAILTGAGIIVAVKKLKDVLEAVTSPIQAFTGLIESLSGTLGAYSKKLKSEALLKIAEAIAVLAASLWIISTIDSDRLLSSVAVLAGVMVSLLGVAKASEKIKITDFGKIGSMMLSLGASLLLISLAMKNMGGMDGAAIEQSIEVIGKLGILFAAMIAVSKFSGSSANKVGTMLLKASVGLLIIAQAMKSIAKMDTADVKKSIEAIGMLELMFVALVAVSKLSGSSADKAGTMLLKASAGLLIIAQAMKSIAKMDKTDIQKSIEAIGMLELMFAALIAVSKLSGADASKAGSMLLKASAGILVLAIAMKSIAKMDKTDIQKSIEAIGMLELMFAALIAVSKLGGKNASGAGTMLLEMSAAILVLAVAMGVFSLLDPADIAIGIAAVTALETMFAVLIAVTKNAKDCKSTMLVIAATIGILAIAVAALTLIDPAKLATATLALDSLMGMFALMVASTSVAKKANLTLIVMTAVVGGLAVILSLLANNTNVDSALVCAGALSLLLLSLSASMLILSNARTISASAYTALITMTGITALLAAIIGVLASFDVGPTLEIAESLSLLLLSLSGACLILSAVGLTGAAAFAGVGALATLIVAVGSLMAAIGALMTYVPSMEEFLDKGMAALEKVGYGLGAFFGNIIGGFAAGVTAGLPDIGSNLSGFMENAQVFFNGIQNIDDGALTGVKNLVETILLLSAGELMSSVTSWLTGGDSMTTFAEQLVPFGEAMVSFSNTIADLDADVVTNAATAGQALAEMASTIPNSGGVVSFFTGENDMEAFGAQLVPFGEAMKSFEEVISGIDAEVITNAATAGKALTEMGSTVPNSGGVVGWFCGENDMGKFGEQLIPFGEAMKEFGDVVDGLSADAIVNAATAGKALTELGDTVPNSGGVVGWFVGENDMGDFGEQLIPFGEAMKAYSDAISGIDVDAVTNSATAGSAVVELANTLPNTGGLVSWFTGDNDIGAFGESLVIFGENFAQYADYMKTVDADIVTATANAATSIVELQKSLPKEGGWFSDDMTLASFGSDMASFGSYFSSFYGYVSGIDTGLLSSVITQTNRLVDMANGMVDLDTSGMSGFSSALATLGQSGINEFIEAFNNAESRVKTAATAMMNTFINGAKAQQTTLTNTFTMLVQAVLTAMNNKSSEFQTTGSTLMTKFIAGVKSQDSNSRTTFTNIISGCLTVLKNKYTEFQTTGSTLMTKFIAGVKSQDSNSRTTFTNIISGCLTVLKNKYTEFQTTGSTLMTKFIAGVKSQDSNSRTTFTNIISACLTVIKNKYSEFQSTGAECMTKLIAGVSSKDSAVKSAFTNSMSGAVSGVKEYYSQFYSAGSYLVDGFTAGINDNMYKAEAKARAMARKAAEAAEDELDEHSPSKRFYGIGSYAGQGFVNALDDYASEAEDSSANMAASAVNGLSNAISKVVDFIEGKLDVEPTIRPVLDLTNVKEGVSTLNTMFTRSQALAINAGMEDLRAAREIQNGGDSSTGNSYQFTQNNYSPKSLSRIEIYRQTKNQFSAFERMVEA